MSPENGTQSKLGPLPRRGRWIAGGAVASLAVVVLGFTSPALATAAASQKAGVAQGGDKCKDKEDRLYGDPGVRGDKDKDKCKGPKYSSRTS
ncbi:hypothetical protein ABZS99_31805 [Streptomyces sp. NPDC005463]|uniref:hypothetical protein n=1 Tax=Streptomyces sp. NPDC005463 TaxID=3154465 RepID=UPI0033A388A7